MIFVSHYDVQDHKLISTSQRNVLLPYSGRQFVLVVVILFFIMLLKIFMALLLLCHLQTNSLLLDLNATKELAQCKYCYDYYLNVIREIRSSLNVVKKHYSFKKILWIICVTFSAMIFFCECYFIII
jgi:hypothetical protein